MGFIGLYLFRGLAAKRPNILKEKSNGEGDLYGRSRPGPRRGGRCRLHRDAVSYTHLDVYKRQDLMLEGISGFTRTFAKAFVERFAMNGESEFDARETIPELGREAHGAVAVSYTHLDVYKRQP